MRVLIYKAGHDLDLTGTWLEQVRGADENAILSVAQMWFNMRQEPCAIFKHEEDGSERRLFGYPLPQLKQSYENACQQLRNEQIERMFEAIVEQRRNEEEENREGDLEKEDDE